MSSAAIDAIQTKVDFDSEGNITSDIMSSVKSKVNKGRRYGMVVASGIGLEWNEQAKGFGNYIKGMTKEEINDIPLDDGGHAAELDLASCATMHVDDSIVAINKAIDHAMKKRN